MKENEREKEKEYTNKEIILISADIFKRVKNLYPNMDIIQLAAFMIYSSAYVLSTVVKDDMLKYVAKGCRDILTNPHYKEEEDEILINEEGKST